MAEALLNELAVCGYSPHPPAVCGKLLIAGHDGYRCPVREPGHAWQPTADVDQFVAAVAAGRLSRSDADDLLRGQEAEDLWSTLDVMRQRGVIDMLMEVQITDGPMPAAIGIVWRE